LRGGPRYRFFFAPADPAAAKLISPPQKEEEKNKTERIPTLKKRTNKKNQRRPNATPK
jgi:hypothetical protein